MARMNDRSPLASIRSLPRDATLRLPRGRGTVVRVERGTVLVTQEGDLEDHVLAPGDALALRPRGLAVAWALTDAALSVRDAREPRPALAPAAA